MTNLLAAPQYYVMNEFQIHHDMFFTCFYSCPHCRPLIVTLKSLHDLESHFHFHGIDLYICLYCNFIHYNRLKIESHLKIKHQLRISDNKFNIVTISSRNPGSCIVVYCQFI